MATLTVCAVFDSAVGAYNRPMFVPSTGAAVRVFSDEVNRKGSPDQPNVLNDHPDDFALECLGTWDEDDGSFSPDGRAVLLRGKDAVRKE